MVQMVHSTPSQYMTWYRYCCSNVRYHITYKHRFY